MADYNYSSVAKETQLSADIDDSQTTITVDATTGFPPAPFNLTIDPGGNEEIVTVTNVVGTTLTVSRNQDGTPNISHSVGDPVRHMMIGRDLQLSRQHEEDDSGVHGLGSGDTVLGRTQAVAVENKIIDGSLNTLNTIPQSAILDLEDDQAAQDQAIIDGDAANSAELATHASDTSTHGVGEILGRTEPATVTNKTIDGDSNTIRDVDRDSLVQPHHFFSAAVPGATISPGEHRFLATMETHRAEPSGSAWNSQGGMHSSQWTHPRTGWYQINVSCEFQRTQANQIGPIDLELRGDMNAGSSDVGSTPTEVEQGYGNGSMGSRNTLQLIYSYRVTSTSEIYGLTLFNGGNADIDVSEFGTHIEIRFLFS